MEMSWADTVWTVMGRIGLPLIGVAFHAHRREIQMSQEPFPPLHLPSEETEGVALQGARCVPSCAGGHTHSETCVGCIVS